MLEALDKTDFRSPQEQRSSTDTRYCCFAPIAFAIDVVGDCFWAVRCHDKGMEILKYVIVGDGDLHVQRVHGAVGEVSVPFHAWANSWKICCKVGRLVKSWVEGSKHEVPLRDG